MLKDDQRRPTPIWLANPDYPAPCPCGRPIGPDDDWIIGQGETGLRRIFHLSCIPDHMLEDDDDES